MRSPNLRFRTQIAVAVAEGLPPSGMILRLTHRDASLLARDRDMPLADIRYRDGKMYFLEVKVETGGVEASVLDRDVA